jgi:16S rRNA (adenine1518-N6/adenine1519-N6)-dimethyltransferase
MLSRLPPALKRLGQNFLIDHNILRKIVALAAIQPGETVLEIGPGRGILTTALCALAERVIAVEIDPQLSAYLTEWFAGCQNLELHCGDALEFGYDSLPNGTVVVANLPYYASTPLLMKFLETRARIARMVIMLQAEVAERLVAKPGTRDYGVLSVFAQCRADIALGFRVSPNCFRPRPDVVSAVVRLDRRSVMSVSDELLPTFTRVVRAAFAHRRKTLINSLRDEGLEADVVSRVLTTAGIASLRRAETLTIEEFIILARAMKSQKYEW